MPSGVLTVALTSNFHADIIRELINNGLPVRLAAISDRIEYQPDNLKEFLKKYKINSFNYEPLYRPDNFDKIYHPNYEILDSNFFKKISYYKELFLLMTDRNSFFPISVIERSRLFNKYLFHFSELIDKNQIDSIIFFGIPHGPWSIALWGLAKSLNINIMYTSPVDISTNFTTIETELTINRKYIEDKAILGKLVNIKSSNKIKKILKNQIIQKSFTEKYINRKMLKHVNTHKKYLKRILSLILKQPFSVYISPEFDLNIHKRMRIACAFPLFKYYLSILKSLRFYKVNSTKKLPNKNSVVLFLHMQPEAALNPLGGYFNDQLLILDLILEALPNDMNVFVKEHPYQYEEIGEDKNERSIDFYKYLIRDERVTLLDRSLPSTEIIENAGVIISSCGTVCWESILIGKPSIVFGWSWFTNCKSCLVVDSVEKLRKAIIKSRSMAKEDVLKDRDDFIYNLQKRLIYGINSNYYLPDAGPDFDYDLGLKNIAKALTIVTNKY